MFRKRKELLKDSALTERAAASIVTSIESLQQQWASLMTRASAHFSHRGQRYILLLFIAGSSLLSITVSVNAIFHPEDPAININRLPFPLLVPEVSDSAIYNANK